MNYNIYWDNFNNSFKKYKWLNLEKLCKCFIQKTDKIIDIYYFSAFAFWRFDKVQRHKLYISALEREGIKFIEGHFRKITKKCSICKKKYKTFEEKETDVNIALTILDLAYKNIYDEAIIISGDSDFIPIIQNIKSNPAFNNKKIGILIPINRKAEHLKQTSDFYFKIKEHHLKTCQFPDQICDNNNQVIINPVGEKLIRPNNWL